MTAAALERALAALLHDPGARAGWHVGTWGPAALADLDPREVDRCAALIRTGLATRRHLGCGGLRQAYRRTLADLVVPAVLEAFQAHPAYQTWREVPAAGLGSCVEEAFFRFAEAEHIGAPEVRRDEYLTAIARALTVDPLPAFVVPPEFRAVPGGWLATDGERAYASLEGRLVIGRLPAAEDVG